MDRHIAEKSFLNENSYFYIFSRYRYGANMNKYRIWPKEVVPRNEIIKLKCIFFLKIINLKKLIWVSLLKDHQLEKKLVWVPHLEMYQLQSRTTDTQWRQKSKISEKLGWCGRQNMLRSYLKTWEWELIFGSVVKAIFSLVVRSPCVKPYLACTDYGHTKAKSLILCGSNSSTNPK